MDCVSAAKITVANSKNEVVADRAGDASTTVTNAHQGSACISTASGALDDAASRF